MPRSRHPHRALPIALLTALILLALTGCYQDQQPPRQFTPGDPLYEQFTTAGDRIVVERPDGGPSLKLRQRRHDTRVYDDHMVPVGRVRIDGEDVIADPFGEQGSTTVDWNGEDTAVLADHWRLEKTDGGWDLFDGDGALLAFWRRDDDRWRVRRTDGTAPSWGTETTDHHLRVVDAEGEVRLEIDAGDLSDVALLALSLEELAPLSRYALARWADDHL